MISATRGLISVLAVALLSSLVAGCAETRLAAGSGVGDPPGVFTHLRKMPLVEVPAAAPAAGPLVVLYTGDNGWAAFDRRFAARLAARGAPVAGVSSLIYFIKPRSPKGAAADLAAVIAHYTRLWGLRDIVLAGYSYGADDLPLIAQALPARVLAQVRLLVLISPADQGDLTFRGASWFDLSTSDAQPLAPALAKLAAIPILCIHSVRDPRQACDRLPLRGMTRAEIPGGHHYVGHEAEMADLILKALSAAAPAASQ
jgi:type IV secretory pathway VirJ component